MKPNLNHDRLELGGAIHLHYPFVKATIKPDEYGVFSILIEFNINGIYFKTFFVNTEEEAIELAKEECIKMTTKAQQSLWRKTKIN